MVDLSACQAGDGVDDMSRRKSACRWISPQDFADLRKQSGMTRKQAAKALDVTVRTIQNWETGGARIPWMAYRMLRVLRGYALPGFSWQGWTVDGDKLIAPNGRWFDASSLEQVEQVFGMARLWRQDYATRNRPAIAVVLPFPDRKKQVEWRLEALQLAQIGGVRG